jgi:hypothetical protein
MPMFLIETITITKKQYLISDKDLIGAQDAVTMREAHSWSSVRLDEIIVGGRELAEGEEFEDVNPIKEGKLYAKKILGRGDVSDF